jgi:hypothetical protein
VGVAAGRRAFYRLSHRRARVRSTRSSLGPALIGAAMARGPSDCRPGCASHFIRRVRKTLLSTPCLGRDAESCASADSPSGPDPCAVEMAEGIDGQKCEPDSWADREAILAGRIVRSLLAEFESRWRGRSLTSRGTRFQPGWCVRRSSGGGPARVGVGQAFSLPTACYRLNASLSAADCRREAATVSPLLNVIARFPAGPVSTAVYGSLREAGA